MDDSGVGRGVEDVGVLVTVGGRVSEGCEEELVVELLMVELLSALEVELLMDGMGELLLELVMLVLVMAKLLSETRS